MKTLIQLPNGREIFSGAPGAAVISARLTRRVNTATDLFPGGVYPAQLTLELTEAADLPISPGHRLTVYHTDGENRYKQGVFLVRSLTMNTTGGLTVTALDTLCLLDRDLTTWLNGLDGWPYSLEALTQMVCDQCGVTLAGATLPLGGIPVDKITARDVTGADLLGWIGQLSGRFCRADRDGNLEFAWYAPRTQPIGPGDFYRGALRATEPAQPIDRVALRPSGGVEVWWPETGDGATTFRMTNALMSAIGPEYLKSLAQNLYNQLSAAVYTPCKLTLPASAQVMPGDILQVTDGLGRSFQTFVMQTVTEQGRTRIESAADPQNRGTASLQTGPALRNKLLQLQSDGEGLRLSHSDNAQRLAQLELALEGIETRVERREQTEEGLQTRLSQVAQKADSVEISVRQITENGTDRVVTRTGYSFTDDGLVIRRQGEQMGNRLDHTGMYVTRGQDTLLQVNHKGVEARDVTVSNYLLLGDHARFEDYASGTACFYI